MLGQQDLGAPGSARSSACSPALYSILLGRSKQAQDLASSPQLQQGLNLCSPGARITLAASGFSSPRKQVHAAA